MTRLEILRNKKKLTKQDLADLTGISRSMISLIEHKKRNLTIDAAKKIAPHLGVSETFLLDINSSTSLRDELGYIASRYFDDIVTESTLYPDSPAMRTSTYFYSIINRLSSNKYDESVLKIIDEILEKNTK